MANGLGSLASLLWAVLPGISKNCIEASSFLDVYPSLRAASLPVIRKRENSEGGEDMYYTQQASLHRYIPLLTTNA